MNISIPVQNNVETIIADVYIQSRVSLRPLTPPQTTAGEVAIRRIEEIMNQKVYVAIQSALSEIEEYDRNRISGSIAYKALAKDNELMGEK